MKKILLLTILLSLTLMSYAGNFIADFMEKDRNVRLKYGTQTLAIVPEKEFPFPPGIKQRELEIKQERKKKGCAESDNIYAKFLLGLKGYAQNEIRAFRGTQNMGDTHLKQSAKEIKLAFEFNGLPIDNKNIIGYAPIGSYIKSPEEGPKEGWNGIKVFFEDKNLGACAYEFTDLNLSHGGSC